MSDEGVYRENPDGSYSPAEPLGWMEEHNRWQRFLFWLTRTPHCNDEAHRRQVEKAKGQGLRGREDA